ncbi:hypothetical protein ACQ86K_31045 [Mucilaginibacter sp. P19]|uniref:hypothetical protein n=1 Tax=Mucilaginibacter sp. P19 TaxID=3423947 RepID=UPI003D6793AC
MLNVDDGSGEDEIDQAFAQTAVGIKFFIGNNAGHKQKYRYSYSHSNAGSYSAKLFAGR